MMAPLRGQMPSGFFRDFSPISTTDLSDAA
jgi:hypothetical protein